MRAGARLTAENSAFMAKLTIRSDALRTVIQEWWPIVLGLLVMYIPVFYVLFSGIWATEEQAHGPLILGLSIWLIYRKWSSLMERSTGHPNSVAGWVVFAVALGLYVVGRSQQIMLFELGSFIWMLAAILLIKLGTVAIKVMWFPLFFMLFMIPLPGTIVTMLTMPMKIAVSYVTEMILYWANYPVARSGVILQIGQFQLLVADACAGLQTLLTLESLGLFYLNVIRHTSIVRNVVLGALIVPISFAANVIRVISLTLITYYFGDEAGQGFLHEFSGIVLFLSALSLILVLDSMLQIIVEWWETRSTQPAR
jgi:exosortase B